MTRKQSANVTILKFADGRELCCSYGVPVAGFVPGRGYLRTQARYSVTTSKHMNQYAGRTSPEVADAELRGLFPEMADIAIGKRG